MLLHLVSFKYRAEVDAATRAQHRNHRHLQRQCSAEYGADRGRDPGEAASVV